MKKIYLSIVSLYTLIACAFTFPAITKMSTLIYGPAYGTDYRGAIRHCWWVKYAFEHHLNWRLDNMLNYPFGERYDWSILSPLWQLFAYPAAILVNEVFALNCVFILSFILSAVSMFILVYYLTKDYKAAFVSGFIYSFCPYHFNKIWEHLGIALIEWLPLYVFLLLRLRQNNKFKDILFCAIGFSLVIFSDFYYGYFMGIFTFCFILFILFYQWKEKLHLLIKKDFANFAKIFTQNLKVIIRILAALFISAIFTLPATFNIIKSIFFEVNTIDIIAQGAVRPFQYLFSQSARPLSYLLPASVHPIFGNFTKTMFGSMLYGRNAIEQTLYLGIVPLILAFFAYKFWKNQRNQIKNASLRIQDDFTIGFFIFSAIICFLISMPPYFDLLVTKIYFPSYFLYKIFTMFRAYARFGIIVMLAVSVLAGFGLKHILQKTASSGKKIALTAMLTFVIGFEFFNMPPLHYANLKNVPVVYKWLSAQKENFAIAEYPIRIGDASEGYMNLNYVLYQSIHHKAMLEGAKPGTDGFKLKQSILKIADPKTADILKDKGFKYVVLHLNDYIQGNNEGAMEIKGEVPDLSNVSGFKLVQKFGDDEVYEIIK